MKTVVQRVDVPLRHRASVAARRLGSWAGYGRLGLRHPIAAGRALRRYPWLSTLLSVNKLLDTMTRGRTGHHREANAFLMTHLISAIREAVDGFISRPSETVMHEDLVPPEILYGMGLNPWMAETLGIMMPMVEPSSVEHYIDAAENAGIPADICSLPKSTMGVVLSGEMPPPVAAVASNMPCDGGMAQYALIEREMGVPTFRLDVPYDFHGERAVDYFTGELLRLIAWLEEHTPGRMDWDRMREVCEERNRATEAELELWETLRARPAPLAAEPIYLSHMVWKVLQPGTPRGTKVFRRLADIAAKALASGAGALEEERYRVALWNPPTMIFLDLFAWAEQVYGAAMLMDMLTFHNHPFIDTTSEESMLRDLARIQMQGPMARHTRGPAENFFGDLFHMVEHFDLDMIWMAGHVGCKNTQALGGMFREKARTRDIPLLFIDYDLSDTRVVSPAGIRRQVATFMETVMGAGAPRSERELEG